MATKNVWMVLAVFFMIFFAVVRHDRNEFRKENAALKAERAEYQMAVWPAVQARGWAVWPVENSTKITPKIVRHVLNPCYATPDGMWKTGLSQCGFTERPMSITIDFRH